MKNLQDLYATIAERKKNSPENSYTAQLFAGGIETIVKKIGEETAETISAAVQLTVNRQRNASPDKLIHECADVFYHYLVLLAYCGVTLTDIETELNKRTAVSGLQEKQNRT